MATIVKRSNRYYVVYLYDDANGNRKQKWESFKTQDEAKRRRTEVEYQMELGKLVVPQCSTLNELLKEYVALYGKVTWSLSTFKSNTAMINNYIAPVLGNMKLTDITSRVLEKYYQQLLRTNAVAQITDKPGERKAKLVGTGTIRKIHNLLRSCFHQAMKWELIEKNPAVFATVPKNDAVKREMWDAETLFRAIEVCEDPELKLAINLAFSCSLRIGELLGLTWDCVDISEKSIAEGRANIYVTKEIQRVNKNVLDILNSKDVMKVFPEQKTTSKTVLVLKKPKTDTSVRKVFLPETVAKMLIDHRNEQLKVQEALGSEYQDYNLVMAGPFGLPMEASRINYRFHELIREHDLPKVVFHSLRHSSITYKLKLNGGDVKSVQGDSGHAQAKMVTDQYSHILDEDRRLNAQRFEEEFYSGKAAADKKGDAIEADSDVIPGADMATLTKLLANPETAGLLKALVKAMEKEE